MDPFQLEWTPTTVEQYSSEFKAAIHVFSHDLGSPEAVDRTIRFALGRARYFQRHLPRGTTQGAWLDDRGQPVDDSVRARLRQALAPCYVSVVFLSEKRK
jgi:hypothetical protein